ncbi:MAG TPA: YciI family protein [Solirubrobacterales bacterium]|jgi:hypothetical protein|nr:YciI family protein [Solirubrobacterales bacterium]
MKYLYTFYAEERVMESGSEEQMSDALARWSAFDREATDAGVMIACEPLQPSGTATTIHRDANGVRTTTDGPFAESKEQLAGFCLLDCKSDEDALEWASKIPIQLNAWIELRAVLDLSQYGYESATLTPAAA